RPRRPGTARRRRRGRQGSRRSSPCPRPQTVSRQLPCPSKISASPVQRFHPLIEFLRPRVVAVPPLLYQGEVLKHTQSLLPLQSEVGHEERQHPANCARCDDKVKKRPDRKSTRLNSSHVSISY